MPKTTAGRPERTRRAVALVVAVAAVAAALAAAPAAAVTETEDVIGVVKESVAPSNVEIAARLSEATPFESVDTVLIGRDDEFADALASGVLQDESPLLLLPSDQPVPDRVRDELLRLAPERVLILGGPTAISAEVEQQLQDFGFVTERRAGDSRFETAVDVASRDAGSADTVILARAFAAPDASDPTQAFADVMAVGAWSAEEGWPILLTQTEALTGPTREYLLASGVERVKLIGGTAAISQAVEDELVALGFQVERVAGADRFETATEVAEKLGAESAADVSQVILADAQFANSWAGGLAAAAHAAMFDAPIVLTSGGVIPPATQAFLAPGVGGDADQPLTCITFPAACEEARQTLGLPPAAVVTTSPADGAVVRPGDPITFQVATGGRPTQDAEVTGTCLPGPSAVTIPSDGRVVVELPGDLPVGECTVRLEFAIVVAGQGELLRQAEEVTFTVLPTSADGGIVTQALGGTLDARQLASNLVGDAVQVFNARVVGAPEAAGLFAGGPEILGFDQGIVLSTGDIASVAGPNESTGTSGGIGGPGDPDLDALSIAGGGDPTVDAMVLEFDFVADASAVRFEYVFGSEEYNEFVGSPYNDVFAFFVNGQNCALVNGQPVSINTINGGDPDLGVPGSNPEFFRDNSSFPAPLNTELDGLTVTLPCAAPIVRGGTNHLKLAIADAGDAGLDSAVFIRAGSFTVE